MPPVTVVGFFKCSEELYQNRILEALGPLSKHTINNEPDTLSYSFYQSSDDPKTLFFVEVFASFEAFRTHGTSDAYKAFFLVVGPMIQYKQVSLECKVSQSEPLVGFTTR